MLAMAAEKWTSGYFYLFFIRQDVSLGHTPALEHVIPLSRQMYGEDTFSWVMNKALRTIDLKKNYTKKCYSGDNLFSNIKENPILLIFSK